MLHNRANPKDKDNEIWTPWVGKRSGKRSGGDRDRDVWTPWVGKRSNGGWMRGVPLQNGGWKGEEEVEEDIGGRNMDTLNEDTWVYPLPRNPYLY